MPEFPRTQSVLETLSEALEHQRSGRLARAEALYHEVLARDPANADALHLLGMLAYTARRHEIALACMARAIQIRPDVAPFHNNLGTVLLALGRVDQACLCFEHALQLTPAYPEAHVNLGNALQELKRFEEAVASYARSLELNPNCAEAHNNLGNALLALGQTEDAVACFHRALSLKPDYAAAYVNLSSAMKNQERFEEAAACCRRAIRIAPDLAEAYSNLASALLSLELLDEAETCAREAMRLNPCLPEPYVIRAVILQRQGRSAEAEEASREALAIRPDYPEAHNNLGNALEEQGRVEEAIACYREALRLKPELADAHYNMGNALRSQAFLSEACACYDKALRLKPVHVKAHWNRSLTKLLMGDLESGLDEFEWRWKKRDSPPRPFSQPLWDGSPLGGRTILLHAEQGLGDTLQFIRYAPLVQRAGGTVIVECQPKLLPLVASVRGIGRLVPAGAPLPAFDVHAPLLSLPRILGTTLATIPSETPYLDVSPDHREQWRRRLDSVEGRRIGLVWAGNPNHAQDRDRSTSLEQLAPLADLPGAVWFGLQFGPRADQALAPPAGLRFINLAEEVADFVDAAAAILNLDLVISVDTSMAHLAGALARPVWVLLSFVPDWRWMLDREDSPWYPTMRLFRQPRRGDWDAVIARVRKALANEHGSRRHAG